MVETKPFALRLNDGSRMSGDVHVRICESLGVKFPRATHPNRLLSSYLDYYHPWRTHRSLDQDAPDGRWVRLAELDQIAEFPVVQGLHHYYLPRVA